jgi:hypothetical protein
VELNDCVECFIQTAGNVDRLSTVATYLPLDRGKADYQGKKDRRRLSLSFATLHCQLTRSLATFTFFSFSGVQGDAAPISLFRKEDYTTKKMTLVY